MSLPPGASTMYTPLQTHWNLHYYNIKLLQIKVDGQELQADMV